MKSFNPYLNFDGNAREAMTFYAKAFGEELYAQTFAEANMNPPGAENRLVHARIGSGSAVLMASDTPPGMPVKQGNNYHINIDCESEAEIEKLFDALGEDGKITMPLQDTFWGARFGMLTDKFGVNWMFNFEKPKK